MTPWVMYVVECRDKSLYCGVTTDITRRLRQHNGAIMGGAKYTRSRRPVRLVYIEGHDNRSESQKAESRFKKRKRADKLVIVSAYQERQNELAEDIHDANVSHNVTDV